MTAAVRLATLTGEAPAASTPYMAPAYILEMMAFGSQDAIKTFYRDCEQLLYDERRWDGLTEASRTQQHITYIFCLVARAMGGCNYLMEHWADGYPSLLFGLLGSDGMSVAHRIVAGPDCLYDEITKALVGKFGTADLLMSEDHGVAMSTISPKPR